LNLGRGIDYPHSFVVVLLSPSMQIEIVSPTESFLIHHSLPTIPFESKQPSLCPPLQKVTEHRYTISGEFPGGGCLTQHISIKNVLNSDC
jgi:hypothetical protein